MKLDNQQKRFVKYFSESISEIDGNYYTRLHENDQIEFKRSFVASKHSMNKSYLRTIAGFANHKSGWIIFGVDPEENEIVGIKTKYSNLDNSLVSTAIRAGIDGTFRYDFFTAKIVGKVIGFLKVDKSPNPPVIVKQSYEEDGISIKIGDIYYRYSAQTAKISATDLRGIIDEEISKKARAFLNKVQQIIKIGTDNTALLNTSTGEISSNKDNVKLILSEDILEKVNLIEEGKLVQKDGAPAYVVKGKIESIIQPAEIVEKSISTGIRGADYYNCFFNLRCANPKVFIKELLYRESQYYPIYFFMQKAKMDSKETIKFLNSINGPEVKTKIKNDIIERLKKGDVYSAIGALINSLNKDENITPEENIESQLSAIADKYELKGNRNKTIFRTIIVNMLYAKKSIDEALIKFGIIEFIQAFSHLNESFVKKNKTYVLNELKRGYSNMNDKKSASYFRKVLCRYDYILFGKLGI